MTELTTSLVFAAAFAVLCWWLGTGIILWLVRLPASTFGINFTALTLLLCASLWLAHQSMQAASVANAYLGFVSAIAMWAWHEWAFLSGWLMGPRRKALDPGATGWTRLRQSVQVILHHELALLANFALLVGLNHDLPNHVALCTFALLWCMRVSAKFNLFFGVPEVGLQYLPKHLVYLGSYFRRGRVSAFFYGSVGGASAVWLWLVWQAQQDPNAITTGWVLLASLLGLAILEHVLMMFPVPLQRLWGWAMRRSAAHGPAITPPLQPVVASLPSCIPAAVSVNLTPGGSHTGIPHERTLGA